MPSWLKLTTENPDEADASPWPMVWAIVIAKIATLVVILIYAWGGEATALIGATMLPWLVVAVGLLAAPVAWQIRLRRARRRRRALLNAEWMGQEPGRDTPKPVEREFQQPK